MRVGAHVPTFGNYKKMFAYIDLVGCECFQIFSASPRSWGGSLPPQKRIDQMHEGLSARKIPLLIHTAYLINMVADNAEMYEKSCDALTGEILRAVLLKATALNTHMGSSHLDDKKQVARRCAGMINEAYERAYACYDGPQSDIDAVQLVLENTAGAGSTFGRSLEEIADTIEHTGLPVDRLGVTIDTCHAWAAGYDLSSDDGWDSFCQRFDELIGLDRLTWIHANDSVHGCGENKDRHAWIGKGAIGLAGFEAMMTHPGLADTSVVLEMPGEMPEKDQINIDLLKALRLC